MWVDLPWEQSSRSLFDPRHAPRRTANKIGTYPQQRIRDTILPPKRANLPALRSSRIYRRRNVRWEGVVNFHRKTIPSASLFAGFIFILSFLLCAPSRADNKVMGQVVFAPAGKVEKSAGVWVDGQYVGHIGELKGDKKVLLLPGDHDITVKQSGYTDWSQKVTAQPGQPITLTVKLEKDPRVQYSKVTSEVKLKVEPDRAAVFLDGAFVGYVHEFGGVGRSMLVAPGKHEIKIALVGYKDFTTEVNLQPDQKFTVETKLVLGSVDQSDPAVKKDQSQ